jgi:L-threonine kinase
MATKTSDAIPQEGFAPHFCAAPLKRSGRGKCVAPGSPSTRDAPSTYQTAQVALPATCGELVQGTLDGIPCLVSCPIRYYSVAQVCLRAGPGWEVPCDAPKAATALHAGLAWLGGTSGGGHLELYSRVPRGRGYGSSTADIGATLYALAQALRRSLTPAQVARLAVSVEPSDSSIFPGLALFAHRTGQVYQDLGPTPALSVLVIDPGGEVDTLAFNRIDHQATLRHLAPGHRQAFDLLRQGLKGGDWAAVGEAATLSSRMHQAILFNPLLDQALTLARQVGALGVCRAHSGSLLGLLVDPQHTYVESAVAFVAKDLPAGVTLSVYAMADGGPQPGTEPAPAHGPLAQVGAGTETSL